MSKDASPEETTSDPGLPPVQFSQCAWCRRRLGARSHPVGEPLLDLSPDASHGICTQCAERYFPVEAHRLKHDRP